MNPPAPSMGEGLTPGPGPISRTPSCQELDVLKLSGDPPKVPGFHAKTPLSRRRRAALPICHPTTDRVLMAKPKPPTGQLPRAGAEGRLLPPPQAWTQKGGSPLPRKR